MSRERKGGAVLATLALALCAGDLAQARIPNDVRFADQWALPRIGAPPAWDITTGNPGIIIAIVDSGVDTLHPDLRSKLVGGYDFVNNRAEQTDDNGHGTHVAGIAAAIANDGLVNSAGIAGVAWQCRIMPVKVLNDTLGGEGETIARGIRYAAENGAHIINLSLQSAHPDVRSAIEEAYAKGCVIVAAAGNDNANVIVPPAAYSETIAVGATDRNDNRARWDWRTDPSAIRDFVTTLDPNRLSDGSNFGLELDVVAPGEDILSSAPDFLNASGFAEMTGTSMAAPHVSGVAALLRSQFPSWSPARIKAQIQVTAERVPGMAGLGWTEEYGFGLVRADRALAEFGPFSAISISGADAALEFPLDRIGIPTQRAPLRRLFVGGAGAVMEAAFSPTAIPTAGLPRSTLFLALGDAGLIRELALPSFAESLTVGIAADFDGNGIADFDDFFLFADGFGASDATYDLDGSGFVDFDDFFIFADQFGKRRSRQ